jgi:hypothetical protein
LTKLWELVFLQSFLGYGYRIGRALLILFAFGSAFALFYRQAYEQGAIVPSDKEIRKLVSECKDWPDTSACPDLVEKLAQLGLVAFHPWIYSFDVMIPVVGFGQKSTWQPATPAKFIELPILGRWENTNLVYHAQLAETAFGWLGGVLLLSFVSGLAKKE